MLEKFEIISNQLRPFGWIFAIAITFIITQLLLPLPVIIRSEVLLLILIAGFMAL
jgi:hypothetical protein